MSRPWQININNLSQGGFAPAWYKETYPSFGNKNQLGTMVNIDMTNSGYITQGPGIANLTNGTQAAAVTTLIKGATDYAVTSDTAYGVGGSKVYQFSSTTVTSGATFPHTIDKVGVTGETGEDVILFQGNLYYSYNYTSVVAGDIGKYDLASTFDDDWGSTVPSGAGVLVGGVPHPMRVGLNDTMAIGNGRYVALYDGTTLQTQALDFPTGSVVQALVWNSDRWWIAVNNTSLTGSNKVSSSIYVWDGTTNSWEMEIKLMGSVGGLHVKNGVLFVWYQDITSTGGYKMGYVSGSNINDLANYTGGLPTFYQITDYKDFIIWNSNGLIFAYGSGDNSLPVRLFQLADGGYSTIGCVVCPFGTPIIASTESTNYKLAQFSGYDTVSSGKTLMFDITGDDDLSPGKIEKIRFNFEKLTSGASMAWSLVNNQGTTIYSDTLSFAKLGATTTKLYNLNGKVTENFQVVFDYATGSTSATVFLKNIKINGTQ